MDGEDCSQVGRTADRRYRACDRDVLLQKLQC